MSITKEALRVETGKSVNDMRNQMIGAVAQLKELVKNMQGVKEKMQGDILNFGTEDIQAVEAIETEMTEQIKAIIS
jgi:hypothetical protein